MADEDFSRGCQDEFFRQALKDRRAQLGFQRQNLAADGGGRDVQMVGGLADRPRPGNLVNVVQKAAMKHFSSPQASPISMASRCLKGNRVAESRRFQAMRSRAKS